ncbi:hypothetical protein ACWEQ8_32040 [Streptomyces noursei]
MYAPRRAAHQIVHSGPVFGRGPEGAATALVLDILILAVVAAARRHAARGHAQQAEAARHTADHLRAAYQSTAAEPLAAMRVYGQRLPAPVRQRQAKTARTTLPLADQPAEALGRAT